MDDIWDDDSSCPCIDCWDDDCDEPCNLYMNFGWRMIIND